MWATSGTPNALTPSAMTNFTPNAVARHRAGEYLANKADSAGAEPLSSKMIALAATTSGNPAAVAAHSTTGICTVHAMT